MIDMSPNLSAAPPAFDGMSHKSSEREGLLGANKASQRSNWHRTLTLLLLTTTTILSLAFIGFAWLLTLKINDLSQKLQADGPAAAAFASDLNSFPLLVSPLALASHFAMQSDN